MDDPWKQDVLAHLAKIRKSLNWMGPIVVAILGVLLFIAWRISR